MENQKGLNVRKIIISLLILLNSTMCLAQQNKYIVIPIHELKDTSTSYILRDYTLLTSSLYKKDYVVKTYNIIFPERDYSNEYIVYLSVLPDIITGRLWSPIDSADVYSAQVAIEDLPYLFVPNTGYYEGMRHMQRKFFNKYVVVVEKDGEYYKSDHCLMELFEIRAMDPRLPSTYGQLNLMDNLLSVKEYSALYKKYYPYETLPLSISPDGITANFRDGWRVWKEYLSDTIDIKGQKAYKFWTAGFSNSSNGPDISRGVDRFIYMSGKGIIAGSYDFYFKRSYTSHLTYSKPEKPNSLTLEEWDNNVMEEKVMIAEELK